MGMVDYALESAGRWSERASCPREVTRGAVLQLTCCHLLMPGASVINTRCSETYEMRTALLSLFGIPLWYHSQSPRAILQVGADWEGWAAAHGAFVGLLLLLQASSQAGGRKITLMVVTLLASPFHARSQTSILGTAGRFVAPRALLSSASLALSAPRP